jgi:hypothetical protein
LPIWWLISNITNLTFFYSYFFVIMAKIVEMTFGTI